MNRSLPRLAKIACQLQHSPPRLHRTRLSSTSPLRSTMSQLYTAETPDGVKNATGLHLITQSTPNGQKVQIMLEELADVYGTAWDTTLINIWTNEQKKDWFLRLDPNGRIPLLVDNTRSPPLPVHESSAELLYLQEHYDKDGKFGFADARERSEMLQWLFFWHGSGAPYQGNTNFFMRYAKGHSQVAIDRFHNETLRVFGVLELHLSGKYTGTPREYLAGAGAGRYSVADMGTWPWLKGWEYSGFSREEMGAFPHLLEYVERVRARPAVQRGVGEKYAAKE